MKCQRVVATSTAILLVLDEFVIDLFRKKSHHQNDDTDLDPEEAVLDLVIEGVVRVQEMEVAEEEDAMNVHTEHDIVSPSIIFHHAAAGPN